MTTEMNLETIAKGVYCGLEGPQNTWEIKTEQAWSAFYAKLESRSNPRPSTPPVDFSQHAVLAVFMGEKQTGGYFTEISKVLQNGDDLEVQVQESSPGDDDCYSQGDSQPYHLVKVPRVKGKVEFRYL